METFEQKPLLKKEKDVSRREFLKIAGLSLAALKFLEWGFFARESEAEKGEAEKKETDEKAEELNELIDVYLEQKTDLSAEKIKENLKKCGFLEAKNLEVHALKILKPWTPYTKRDVLKESLNEALADKTLLLDKNSLNIVQTNFSKIGLFLTKATYLDDYKAIVINQETLRSKREKIEELVYKRAVLYEYQRVEEIISNSDLTDFDKNQKKIALLEWHDACLKNPRKISEIPELISRNIELLKKSIKDFSEQEAIRYMFTKTNLPHEAFHYFYESGFLKEGYEGPSAAEWLAIALRGKNVRFGKKEPGYAYVNFVLTGLDIENQEELQKFCEEITRQYDLTDLPEELAPKEWQKLNENEQNAYWIRQSLSMFLNEYLARIYNGALGNTPQAAEMEFADAVGGRNADLLTFDFEDVYHQPTDEELAALKKIKWKGSPIL